MASLTELRIKVAGENKYVIDRYGFGYFDELVVEGLL